MCVWLELPDEDSHSTQLIIAKNNNYKHAILYISHDEYINLVWLVIIVDSVWSSLTKGKVF